jgi:DNA-directed RNA polymerase subunit N (RpoN/RPB10)
MNACLFPVRCYTCGKVFTEGLCDKFKELTEAKVEDAKIWEKLCVTRLCCKKILRRHPDIKIVTEDDLLPRLREVLTMGIEKEE